MVVADSGPLIAFARLSLLGVLQDIFGEVLVPETVADECTFELHRPGARAIAAALDAAILTRVAIGGAKEFAEKHLLDAGEAATLLLAQARACPALMDERRGRHVAGRLDIPVVGTVGVLLAARRTGRVGKLLPLFEALGEFGYRIPPTLVKEVLERVGEL